MNQGHRPKANAGIAPPETPPTPPDPMFTGAIFGDAARPRPAPILLPVNAIAVKLLNQRSAVIWRQVEPLLAELLLLDTRRRGFLEALQRGAR